MMYADRSKGAVVLSSGPAVTDIAAHFIDAARPIAAPVVTKTLPEPLLDQYAGTYESGGLTYRISVSGGRLDAQIVGQPAAALYPSRWPDHFYYRVVQAYIEFVREHDRVVGLILTQAGQRFPVFRLGRDGKPLATSLAPSYPAPFVVDAATLASYAGSYAEGGSAFSVTSKGAHLFAQLTGQSALEIYASSKDEFYYKEVDAQITFTRGPDGTATGLILHQNGRELTVPKSPPPAAPASMPPSTSPSR